MIKILSHATYANIFEITWVKTDLPNLMKLIYWNEGPESDYSDISQTENSGEQAPQWIESSSYCRYGQFFWDTLGGKFKPEYIFEETESDEVGGNVSENQLDVKQIQWSDSHECKTKSYLYKVTKWWGHAFASVVFKTEFESAIKFLENNPDFNREDIDTDGRIYLPHSFETVFELFGKESLNLDFELEPEAEEDGGGIYYGCELCEPTETNLENSDFVYGDDYDDEDDDKDEYVNKLILNSINEYLSSQNKPEGITALIQSHFMTAVEELSEDSAQKLQNELSNLPLADFDLDEIANWSFE